jgi:hypothetical protein
VELSAEFKFGLNLPLNIKANHLTTRNKLSSAVLKNQGTERTSQATTDENHSVLQF